MIKYSYLLSAGIIIGILCSSFKESQAQTHEWLSDDFPGSVFSNCIEIKGKNYVVAGNSLSVSGDSILTYQFIVYEVLFDKNNIVGITLREHKRWLFSDEDWAVQMVGYNHDQSQWIILLCARKAPNEYRYKVLLFDNEFLPLSERGIEVPSPPVMFFYANDGDQQHLLGSVDLPQNLLFSMKFSNAAFHDLPEIQLNQTMPQQTSWISSVDIDPRTSNLVVFSLTGLVVLDSSLHLVSRHDYNIIGTRRHGTVKVFDNAYYSHGGTSKVENNVGSWLVLQKYDTSFNVLRADTLGALETDNYPFILNSLEHRNEFLMVGGHLDGPIPHFNFDKTIKKFYLAKYDKDLNQIWYKEYGGDKAYVMYGLHMLEDGSCLLYGFVTNQVDGFRYAYLMHVDENGNIRSSDTIPTPFAHSIRVVSPGNEIMQILNPDAFSADFDLYDMLGRQVLNGQIREELTEIQTTGLPAAIYSFAFRINGKLVTSGKWVKKE